MWRVFKSSRPTRPLEEPWLAESIVSRDPRHRGQNRRPEEVKNHERRTGSNSNQRGHDGAGAVAGSGTATCGKLQEPGPPGLLRRHLFPSGDRRLHDPGRRPVDQGRIPKVALGHRGGHPTGSRPSSTTDPTCAACFPWPGRRIRTRPEASFSSARPTPNSWTASTLLSAGWSRAKMSWTGSPTHRPTHGIVRYGAFTSRASASCPPPGRTDPGT